MTEPVYDVVAAFVARLAALGVTEAVISPGSRSTPLTLCFDAQPRIRTWIQLDERSAGFFALGLGRATGRPAVLVCTSGTAAANYLPAVVEASHGGVPMIVCTADRPPELRGWGSPQTIDQVGLYGTAVRWSIDLPVPDEASVDASAGWADAAFARASGSDPGPVHLNWPLREPLEPVVDGSGARGVRCGRRCGAHGRRRRSGPVQGVVRSSRRSLPNASGEWWWSGSWSGGGLDRELQWAGSCEAVRGLGRLASDRRAHLPHSGRLPRGQQ